MKEKTVQELKQMMDNKVDFQLIDVRESNEYELSNLGGELIPLGTIRDNIDKISTSKQVIVHKYISHSINTNTKKERKIEIRKPIIIIK